MASSPDHLVSNLAASGILSGQPTNSSADACYSEYSSWTLSFHK